MPPGVSRYLDIAAELRARIEGGEWEPGAKLPRMADLAREYGVNRDTLARAIAILEAEGLVWAVPRRGTVVRYGMSRPRRPRGNQVKRNVATDSPGYSFPSASGQEVWTHRIQATARPEKMTDPRLARMLGVPEGTEVMRQIPGHRPSDRAAFPDQRFMDPSAGRDRRSGCRRPGTRAPATGSTGLRPPGTARSHGGKPPRPHADQGRSGPPADPRDVAGAGNRARRHLGEGWTADRGHDVRRPE